MTRTNMGPRLFGGVVAFNEEDRIEAAVRSLLDQKLPTGAQWTEVCVVASGCTDRTAEVARSAFATEPRVRMVEEPYRAGKAAAVNELFRRAVGDWFVLLDGDCQAGPGSVDALLGVAGAERIRPVAVGARHVPPPIGGTLGGSLEFLWYLLHQRGEGGHSTEPGHVLLDNLSLLPVGGIPPIPSGTINDAEYLEGEILRQGGSVRYAPQAEVEISVPSSFPGYIRLRRRILAGHSQVRTRTGSSVPSLSGQLRTQPARSGAMILASARRQRISIRSMGALFAAEAVAHLISFVDASPNYAELSRWPRIPAAPAPARRHPGG